MCHVMCKTVFIIKFRNIYAAHPGGMYAILLTNKHWHSKAFERPTYEVVAGVAIELWEL